MARYWATRNQLTDSNKHGSSSTTKNARISYITQAVVCVNPITDRRAQTPRTRIHHRWRRHRIARPSTASGTTRIRRPVRRRLGSRPRSKKSWAPRPASSASRRNFSIPTNRAGISHRADRATNRRCSTAAATTAGPGGHRRLFEPARSRRAAAREPTRATRSPGSASASRFRSSRCSSPATPATTAACSCCPACAGIVVENAQPELFEAVVKLPTFVATQRSWRTACSKD